MIQRGVLVTMRGGQDDTMYYENALMKFLMDMEKEIETDSTLTEPFTLTSEYCPVEEYDDE